MIYKFYDTCSLLKKVDSIDEVDSKCRMAISSITLNELEHIKTAYNKDPDVKVAARKLINWLDEHINDYDLVIYETTFSEYVINREIELTNDTKILACAYDFAKVQHPEALVFFVTNDLCLKHLARLFFPIGQIDSVKEEAFDYDGYYEAYLNEEDMAYFYSHQNLNQFNLKINQYLIVYDKSTKEIVDRLVWTGEGYRHLNYNNFNSKYFGEVRPYKNDVYQQLVADSFVNNKITMVKGPAGSGKTYLSLSYLLHMLDRGRIDKIIVFCNTVATKNSAKLGYYPGTRDEKLLDSQIGNLLTSKLGGRVLVEQMINEEKLLLLPMSDIRGFDTSGMRAGIYISEAQNMDISLMKLALQRIGEDSICIIDGDCKTQVDDISFAGSNNGMRRASKVFRGEDIYGEITLKNIHRSQIASIAEKM